MALANEILVGRFSGILHKLLSMKEGAPSPQLSPEIMPVIALEVDRPEYDFLAGVRRGSSAASYQSSAAGKFGQFSIRNPSGSGLLAVISNIAVSNNTRIGNFEIRQGSTDAAPVIGTSRTLDLRLPGQTLATNIWVEEVAVLTGTLQYRFRPSAISASGILPILAILPPGTNLYVVDSVQSAGASEIIQVSAMIVERPLEPSETR